MLITIAIPFYNAEKYLRNSILCILNQTYKNFELLLIDDGSTDKSLDIARSFDDKRISVISDGINRGLPYRLNEIIKKSEGEFILRMDADDLCSFNRVERLFDEFKLNDELDVVFSKVCSITDDLEIRGIHGAGKYDYKKIALSTLTKGQTGFIHASLLARKSWYLRNMYNECNVRSEDYELYISAFLNNDFKASCVDEILYFYREDGNTSFKTMRRAYLSQIDVLKRLSKTDTSSLFSVSIFKTYIKLFIIRLLSSLNLMSIIKKRRGTKVNMKTYKSLEIELNKILKVINV